MRWKLTVVAGILVLVGAVVLLTIAGEGSDGETEDLRLEVMRLRSQLDDRNGELVRLRERVREAEAKPPAEGPAPTPAALPPVPAVGGGSPDAEIAVFHKAAKRILARYEDIEPMRGTIVFRDDMKTYSPYLLLHTLVPEDIDRALTAHINHQLDVWVKREGPLAEADRTGYSESVRRHLVVVVDLQRRADTLRDGLEGDIPMSDEDRTRREQRLIRLTAEIGGLRRRAIAAQFRYLCHEPKD